MNVYKKLQETRTRLSKLPLKKSGQNANLGYEYFELKDFMPQAHEIFNEIGLCGVVSFTKDLATLTITDVEDQSAIVLTSPMAKAELENCSDIQNIGATQTYCRRYLWTSALELNENDLFDSISQKESVDAEKRREMIYEKKVLMLSAKSKKQVKAIYDEMLLIKGLSSAQKEYIEKLYQMSINALETIN